MNRHQVQQNMEAVLGLMRDEQELRLELHALDFSLNTEESFAKATKKQREIIRKIDAIRQEKMLPIMRKMVVFIATKTEEQNKLSTTS